MTIDLPKLHEKLGPLVRLGPNEVSFYSVDMYDAVHKVGSKFKKDPRVYGEFVQGGNPALFSITYGKPEISASIETDCQMHKLEGLMMHHIGAFMRALSSTSDEVNLMPACRALEADIICYRTPYNKAMADFHQWTESSWRTTLSATTAQEKPLTPFPNLIQTMVNSGLPPMTALSEATENLGPGTDTTSATLAHILWALAHNPGFQDALFADLAAVSFSADMTTLEAVPRLRAAVKEGIRWTGAASAMLPRIVPDGEADLFGYFLPAGTVVSSSPIWYLHDPVAFPEPKTFDPYRWLTPDGRDSKDDMLRDRFYLPFSKGANVCMGAQ
ncbi:hypothetical protein KJ359_006157 [Pestalotiopsis sp. 9143b]|nr:hypothetical protein KJ359_006157 [Pestalotiopsis sp. 9143b]